MEIPSPEHEQSESSLIDVENDGRIVDAGRIEKMEKMRLIALDSLVNKFVEDSFKKDDNCTPLYQDPHDMVYMRDVRYMIILRVDKSDANESFIIKGYIAYSYDQTISQSTPLIDHANIASVKTKFEVQNSYTFCLTLTPFFKEKSLKEALSQDIDFTTWKLWLTRIAEGMLELEKNDIIHIQLRSSKIFIERRNVKITGMGLPRTRPRFGNTGCPIHHWTTAPEMLFGGNGKKPSRKTGVYLFGMLMYEFVFKDRLSNWIEKGSQPDERRRQKIIEESICYAPVEFILLFRQCTSLDPSLRPGFKNILKLLENFFSCFEDEQKWKSTLEGLRNDIYSPGKIAKNFSFDDSDDLQEDHPIVASAIEFAVGIDFHLEESAICLNEGKTTSGRSSVKKVLVCLSEMFGSYVGRRELYLEENSVVILEELKERAESRFFDEVQFVGNATTAVIAVPPNFSHEQRQVVMKAAEKVGFKKIIFVSKAFAATVGNTPNLIKRRVLLCGIENSLTVTIVRTNGLLYESLNVSKDDSIGSTNVDNLVFEHFLRENKNHLAGGQFDRDRLFKLSEDVKYNLFMGTTTTISTDVKIMGGKVMTVKLEITRDDFEQMLEESARKALSFVENAIDKAGLEMASISEIILYGRSILVLLMKKVFTEKFGEDKLDLPKTWTETIDYANKKIVFGTIKIAGASVVSESKRSLIVPHPMGIDITDASSEITPSGVQEKACTVTKHVMFYSNSDVQLTIYGGIRTDPRLLGEIQLEIPENKFGFCEREISFEADGSYINLRVRDPEFLVADSLAVIKVENLFDDPSMRLWFRISARVKEEASGDEMRDRTRCSWTSYEYLQYLQHDQTSLSKKVAKMILQRTYHK